MAFLPITKEEMKERGWDAPDIVVVTGDAYVDHPSFGTAIVSRVLEAEGFRVCILPQPQGDEDFLRFGRPQLAFFVNGGNIDSMVAHYTAAGRRRHNDFYTAGGRAGRPPRSRRDGLLAGRSAVFSAISRSASGDWKPPCGALPTMITGTMPYALRF